MNFNAYFFLDVPKGYSQYPDNYSKDIISGIIAQTPQKRNISQFAISRNGKLAYATYIYRYTNSQCFGICLEYNNIVPTNFEYLLECFENLIDDILHKGEILHYDRSGNICAGLDTLADRADLLNYYVNYLSKHLDDKSATFISLPAQNYTSEKKRVAVISYTDAQVDLSDYLAVYENIVISHDNPYTMGYVNTLKKSSAEITRLQTELAKLNRQKKQYRMVGVLIIAVIGCLIALIGFNKNIHSLNGTLSDRETEIRGLNNQLSDATARIDSLTKDISTKETHIKAMRGKIKTLQGEIDRNKCLIDSLRDTITMKEEVISNQKVLISDYSKSKS